LSFGYYSNSQVILFDGIYSLMSVVLSYAAYWVMLQVESDSEDIRFPFGRANFEPMFVLIKNIILIIICTLSIVNAIFEISNGGNTPDAEAGSFYASVSFLGCFIVYIWLSKFNRKLNSPLVKTEMNQWLGDTLLSAGILIGFLFISFYGEQLDEKYTRYIDPSLLLITSLAFLLFPLKSIKETFLELIFMNVDKSLYQQLDDYAKDLAISYGSSYKLRAIKIGRELKIELNICTDKTAIDIDKMDKIREQLIKLSPDFKKHWININFTKNKAWI